MKQSIWPECKNHCYHRIVDENEMASFRCCKCRQIESPISDTDCGCMCHTDEYPRYAESSGIIVCDDCKSEPCETVLEEQRMELNDEEE